jgi:hypothetical protein
VNTPSLDEQVESLFPFGGPYGDEETRAAARSIAVLVRYLNHATWHASSTLHPSTIDSAIHALSGPVAGLDQLLRQLHRQMATHAARPEAYATGAESVAIVGGAFGEHIDDARGYLSPAQQALSAAAEFSSRLGLREPDDPFLGQA